MTCSIFIKSCPKDFGFLSYALKSVHKFASGFEEVVVLIPEGSDLPLTQERVIKVSEPDSAVVTMHGVGYVRQQIFKMSADKYCKSDFILHLDSDTIFNQPVKPETFFIDGNPMWLMTPMIEVLAGDKNSHAHATSMFEFSGINSEFEYMRRMGQVIPRWAYACFREYCQEKHGMSFEKWALGRGFRGVSEFNFMGQLMHREYPGFFHFHDTRFGLPESVVLQNWSWDGLTSEIREKMEVILA